MITRLVSFKAACITLYLQILLYVISIQKWDWGGGGGSIDSNVSNIRSNPLSRVSTGRHVTNDCMEKKGYI